MSQWVCQSCGNDSRFKGKLEVSKTVEQDIEFAGEDENNYEVMDEEDADEEIENGVEEVTCANCGSSECDELSNGEYETWRTNHFNKENDFFEEELTTAQRKKSTEALKVAFEI